jgi:hypothetical protein
MELATVVYAELDPKDREDGEVDEVCEGEARI